jgi:hypothetical protein
MGERESTRTWWCDFACRGRRFRLSTGTADKRAASLVAARLLEQRAAHGPAGDPYHLTRKADPLVLVTEYETHQRARGLDGKHVGVALARLAGCSPAACALTT